MACSRFEYTHIVWSTMEGCTTERWWDLWSRNKNWEWLPPGQQLRHRRQGDAVYLGDGMTNVKYNLIHHENLELKPTWKMYPDMYVELFLEGCYCTKERGWSDRYRYIYIYAYVDSKLLLQVYSLQWHSHHCATNGYPRGRQSFQS